MLVVVMDRVGPNEDGPQPQTCYVLSHVKTSPFPGVEYKPFEVKGFIFNSRKDEVALGADAV